MMTDAQIVTKLKIKGAEARVKARPPSRVRLKPPPGGPGTELKAMLLDLGAKPDSGCQCNARAAEMDTWGPEGCRQHRAEIVQWLKDQGYKSWLGTQLSIGFRALTQPWFRIVDPVGSIVDEAIRRYESTAPDIRDTFDRVVLINLKRRKDRLDAALAELERVQWPFRKPEVFEAVDCKVVPCPPGWNAGGGAYACRQSHLRVLEDALKAKVEHLLVLEDDICFWKPPYSDEHPEFTPAITDFLKNVPDDYDGFCLGGQHHGKVDRTAQGVVRVSNCQRTHAYSATPVLQHALYSLWAAPTMTTHIDHVVGEVQSKYRIYSPAPFLIGQSASTSDIDRDYHVTPRSQSFWVPPKGAALVILFRGPREVLDAMRERGWHSGNNRSKAGIDIGLEKIYGSGDLKELTRWVYALRWEAASIEQGVVVAWHPLAQAEHFTKVGAKVIEVEAQTVEEAVAKTEVLRS